MELTSDMIALQGILSRLSETTGEFTKINFRGGNEGKILDIVSCFHKFLSSQRKLRLPEETKVDFRIHDKWFEEMIIFLALNTNYKNSLDLPEYTHLMNVLPPISKCLFISIICGLEMCRYLCSVINLFPLKCSVELLEEIIPCLEKMPPKVHLNYSSMFLKAAANKLASINPSQKVQTEVDNMTDVTNLILRNLSGIYSDQIKNWKAEQIYQHMAYCLLDLLDLLLLCDASNPCLRKFFQNVVTACCSVAKNITINVFCSWAEIQEEDGTLQTSVSNKAYLVIESFQKHPEAAELLGMLAAIAKKPLTLSEQIYLADTATMIKKINKNDSQQKNWFKALVATRKFNDEKVVECLSQYNFLCSEDDVNLLLNHYVESKNSKTEALIKKSASNLTLEQLVQVATKHFYRNKFKHVLTADNALRSTLDKVKQDDDRENELPKKMLLSFLDSPESALKYIYTQCLRSPFYTDCLKSTFLALREILKIDNFGVTCLLHVVEENPPSAQNFESFKALFQALLETGVFTGKTLVLKVVGVLIKKFHEEELNLILEILKQCEVEICVDKEHAEFIKFLLKLMYDFRCRFLKFDSSRQVTVKHIVDIFCDKCQIRAGSEANLEIENEDQYTSFYRQMLSSTEELSILKNLCPEFDISDYGKCVHQLIQILPPMVGCEWILMSKEIIRECGDEKCMELLTDLLILLSEVVQTQNDQTITSALKYCLQNYGLVIQHEIQKNSTMETEVIINKQVCRLLAKLPEDLKEEQGLLLINTLSDNSLKSLANDKEFLCQLILIKNPKICQILAQKISQ